MKIHFAFFIMVGPPRIELGTSCTPCKRATRLRYGPKIKYVKLLLYHGLASFFLQLCCFLKKITICVFASIYDFVFSKSLRALSICFIIVFLSGESSGISGSIVSITFSASANLPLRISIAAYLRNT